MAFHPTQLTRPPIPAVAGAGVRGALHAAAGGGDRPGPEQPQPLRPGGAAAGRGGAAGGGVRLPLREGRPEAGRHPAVCRDFSGVRPKKNHADSMICASNTRFLFVYLCVNIDYFYLISYV